MRVSAIVCTRNRADSIHETLAALAQQETAPSEIIVVDTSNEAERAKVAQCARDHGARYVFEPRSGLSIARNTGIANASGEIIAFTDDDCIPARDWLTQKLRNFSDPAVWACTGRVVQHSNAGACDLFEEVAGQDLGGEPRVFSEADLRFGLGIFLANIKKIFAKHMKSRAPGPWCIGHGSSTAFRKEVFGRLGGFDERLGGGAPLKSCDDTEMFYRILKSGHLIVYEPAAVVRHKHGLTREDVCKTKYGYSYGGAAFMWERRKDPLMLFMFCGRLLQLVIKTVQYKLLRKEELARVFSSDLRGFLDGWAAYRKLYKASGAHSNQPPSPP